MRLDEAGARARLVGHDHAVLSTVHHERGVDAVPCVYAVVDEWLGIPIDTVKPKASGRLGRERNLAVDPRAALLIDRWDPDDWTQLWWVKADLRWQPDAGVESALAAALEARYRQYEGRPFARLLAFRIVRITGWSADADPSASVGQQVHQRS